LTTRCGYGNSIVMSKVEPSVRRNTLLAAVQLNARHSTR
jgi:hypothetical protein